MNTSTEVRPDQSVFVKMALSAWETENTRVSKLLTELSDDELMLETAPGRNRGIYLLGHLAAVSDGMFPLLGFGEKNHPELAAIFIASPDKSGKEMPSLTALRTIWTSIGIQLGEKIKEVKEEEWFARHTAVTPEDFAKEPFRNKLNIMINRTNHISYHRGQLVYLKKK